jgi:SMODS-associating 4TM effector domain
VAGFGPVTLNAKLSLHTAQNTPEALDLLARMRRLYSKAKQFSRWQVLLVVVCGVMATFLLLRSEDMAAWVVLFSTTVGLVEVFLLEARQEHYRELAARVQEVFDGELFDLDWNEPLAGPNPMGAELEDHLPSASVKPRHTQGLADWYEEPALAQLPLPLGRILCQLTNVVWDARLRLRFTRLLWLVLCGLCVTVVGGALGLGYTVKTMLLVLVAGFGPAICWLARAIREHHQAAAGLDDLRDFLKGLWDEALDGDRSPAELRTAARQVQDEIFRGRADHPMVPDWFYGRHKDALERVSRAETAEWAKTALSREEEWRQRLS